MDTEKVKAWLSRIAANYRERKELAFFEGGELVMCSGGDGVQLSDSIRKIAKQLEIVCTEKLKTPEVIERKYRRLSFMYEGVEFFELEELEE